MPDLERRAIVRFGLSFSEFWDSTPRELDILMKQKAYQMEWDMNQVRHVMAAIANSVPRKQRKVFKPQDMLTLPMIDNKDRTAEEVMSGQEAAELALKKRKELDAKLKKDGSN